MAQNVLVREYSTTTRYQWDASALSIRGWEVIDVTQAEQRPGCVRMLCLGPFAFLIRPKPKLIVTYRRGY